MARSARSVLLVKILQNDDTDQDTGAAVLNMVSLGSYKQVVRLLEQFNTAPDGSNAPESAGLLFGPGITVQMPMVGPDDHVAQIVVSLNEEDMAFPVLMRICRTLGWKMMDPASGRTFGG